MPIRVLNKGKEMYVNSIMEVAQKPRSVSNRGLSKSSNLYLEQLIKEEQVKKLKELMERNNFSKSKSLRGVSSKSYRSAAMGKIEEEEEVEEIRSSNGVKKIEGLCLRSKSYGFR
ncbi:hypothetical protein DCAR_0626404 [Daucus carota subsp. sativus]|uniref:Uncharacterized protein n=1 Tax=Daucus carota subsp. sativus TaxID=79200 RepID=A0A164X1V1_DAUCS|nr:hypothetical protein DCAR_0626404 [Daucus carota subsp. sativus]